MSQPATQRRALKQRLQQERGRVWIVGHRGAMGYRPENTLPSFEYAVKLGADWIECDVHLSRDGELIVIHDETLDRTTNGHGLVRSHTLAELKQLDAGSGAQLLTLGELLDWARQHETIVDIEIKNAPIYYEGISDKVVRALRDAHMVENAIVISFDHRAVGTVKSLEPTVATGVLYAARPADAGVGLARLVSADAVLPHHAYVTREDVAAAHEAGLSVAPWTTSDPAVLRGLIAAGVDAIGTNHPDILRGILEETGKAIAPAGGLQSRKFGTQAPSAAAAPRGAAR